MKSAPWELSNDVLHNVESQLYQNILIVDKLPRTTLIGNILITISATAVRKYFLDLHLKMEQFIYVGKDSFTV